MKLAARTSQHSFLAKHKRNKRTTLEKTMRIGKRLQFQERCSGRFDGFKPNYFNSRHETDKILDEKKQSGTC